MDKEANESWRMALAENLSQRRKQAGLTQSELGEKLNYSDKSVSKWERGDGVPDVSVLVQLSDLYGVSVDDLLGRTPKKESEEPKHKHPVIHRVAVTLTMCAIVLISALVVYVILTSVLPSLEASWMAFVIAMPVMFLCMGIAFLHWKAYAWAMGAMSVALWTACLCVQLLFRKLNPALIYSAGGIVQLASIVVCGFILLHKAK